MTRARPLALTAAVLAPVVVGALLSLTRWVSAINKAAPVLVLGVVAAQQARARGLVGVVSAARLAADRLGPAAR